MRGGDRPRRSRRRCRAARPCGRSAAVPAARRAVPSRLWRSGRSHPSHAGWRRADDADHRVKSPPYRQTTPRPRRAVRSASPVVTSVTRMRSACSSLQSAHKFRCRSGSPPVSITRWTRSARIASTCRDKSSALISRFSALAFQMSHITQRQLHALCTLSARIGRLSSRPVTRLRARRVISAGPTISGPRTRVPAAASSTRAGRSSVPRAGRARRRWRTWSAPRWRGTPARARLQPRTACRRSSSFAGRRGRH